jgi:hypothetical protein
MIQLDLSIKDLVMAQPPEAISMIIDLSFPIANRVLLSNGLEKRFGITVDEELKLTFRDKAWRASFCLGHAYFDWDQKRVRLEVSPTQFARYNPQKWRKLVNQSASLAISTRDWPYYNTERYTTLREQRESWGE